MRVRMPGQAFDAIRKSLCRKQHPDIWRNMLNHRLTASKSAGVTIEMDLCPEVIETVYGCLSDELTALAQDPVQGRSVQVIWLHQALGQLDLALRTM